MKRNMRRKKMAREPASSSSVELLVRTPSKADLTVTASESAASHSGKPLLRTLSRAELCHRLSERFPTAARAINVEALASSSEFSFRRIQTIFWSEIRRQVRAGDAAFLRDLVGPDYYEYSRRFEKLCPYLYQRKASPWLLLNDVVFFSDVCNPAFDHSEILQPLAAPLDHVYIHSVDLTKAWAHLSTLMTGARMCESEANQLKASFGSEDYSLLWHGTTGVAAKGIFNDQEIRQSGEPYQEAHDFGPGVYAFSDVLHALSFAVDRAFMQIDEDGKRGDPALLCFCLPNEMLRDYFNVNDGGRLVGRDRDVLQRRLKTATPFNPADPYEVDDLDNWQQFVKFCWQYRERSDAFSDNKVFYGRLHDCDKVLDTEKCARPVCDADQWQQWCLAFRDLLFEGRCKFFFFELNFPHLFKLLTKEQCDEAIVEATRN